MIKRKVHKIIYIYIYIILLKQKRKNTHNTKHKMGSIITPTLAILLLVTTISFTSTDAQFKCSSTSKCNSIIDYTSPNDTTLLKITTLFGVSNNLLSFLGANNFPSTTSPSLPIKAKQSLKIPFPCRCSSGTGTSDGLPVYTVVPNDGLYHIAAEVFGGLITFQQIQDANNISDANRILVGRNLTIPLPCSCDQVGGDTVVHYGHLVPAGSTVDGIAKEFDTTEETLLKLNGLANSSDLLANTVLDVPLKTCTSRIKNTSPDYPLLVTNGTYVLTANNCVKCSCDAANNYTLQCEPSRIKSSSGSSCPSTQCSGAGNLSLGNTTFSGCNRTTCSYEGFNNQTILTTLVTDSTTCAAPANGGKKISSQSPSWNLLLIAIQLLLLSLHAFQ